MAESKDAAAPAAGPGAGGVAGVPADLDERLKAFVRDNTATRLDLPPTEQRARHAIHEKAFQLGLVAVSEGAGAARHAVVYKSTDADAVMKGRLQRFAADASIDKLELPPAPEPIRYSTRLAARALGLTAISEGAGKNRHVVVWKALTETKIHEQLRSFAAITDPAINRMELPPASGKLRFFTAQLGNDYGLTSISEGVGAERHCVVYKVPPPQHRQLHRQHLKQLFDSFDANRDGALDMADVAAAMRVQKLPESYADNFFHSLNKTARDSINFEEFYAFVSERDREIRNVFNSIDTEHTGFIPVSKVRRALNVLNMYPAGGVNVEQGMLNALVQKGEQQRKQQAAGAGASSSATTTPTPVVPAGHISYDDFRDFCSLLTPVDFDKLNDEWLLATDENRVWAAWGRALGRMPGDDAESSDAVAKAKVDATAPAAAKVGALIDAHALWSGFAGGLANAWSRTCVAPAERVRLQMSVDPTKYKSMTDCFRGIYQSEGLKGYWRGNWINVIRIFPQGAVAFFTNDFFKDLFGGKKATQMGVLASSMLSGMFCMTAVYPLDMIRGRVSTTPGLYKGLWDGLKTVYKTEGFRALYLGLGPGNAWAVPYYGAQFYTYETLKRSYAKYAPRRADGKPPQVGSTLGALFGGLSGVVCVTVAYPFELVRRRLQTQGLGGRPVLYSGMFDCFKKIVRGQELVGAAGAAAAAAAGAAGEKQWAIKPQGVTGLFRGLAANLLKTPLSTAIVFMCHETLLKIGPKKKH